MTSIFGAFNGDAHNNDGYDDVDDMGTLHDSETGGNAKATSVSTSFC